MGNVYQKMKKRKTDAYKAFDKAIELNPEFILALMARAILTDWKNYDAAIYDYDRVVQLNRTYHFAYKARGQVKLLSKDFTNAMG